MSRTMSAAAVLAAVLLASVQAALAQPQHPRVLGVNPLHGGGFALYQMKCGACHGEEGRGDGPLAHLLVPRPADFSRGMFKLRSTPPGCLPLDTDIAHSITQGLHGSAMRPFGLELTPRELDEIVKQVRALSPRFFTEPAPTPVPLPAEPGPTVERIVKGRKVYERESCAACHGDFGRGNGGAASDLTDARGLSIRPHDFTLWGGVKAGRRPADFYRSLTTGLDGTPMHDFSNLSEEDRWALVYYLISISEQPAPDVKPDGSFRSLGRASVMGDGGRE